MPSGLPMHATRCKNKPTELDRCVNTRGVFYLQQATFEHVQQQQFARVPHRWLVESARKLVD